MHLLKPRPMLSVAGLALTFAVGCGGEKTNVSAGVGELNKQLSAQGAQLECPKEIDGGEGAQFDCKMKGTKGGKQADVKLKVVKEGGNLAVDIADQQQFQSALQSVTG